MPLLGCTIALAVGVGVEEGAVAVAALEADEAGNALVALPYLAPRSRLPAVVMKPSSTGVKRAPPTTPTRDRLTAGTAEEGEKKGTGELTCAFP